MSRSRRNGHSTPEFTNEDVRDDIPRVYIIVKYFDPLIEYHFNDRQSETQSFTRCGIKQDWWQTSQLGEESLACLQQFNPSVGYGLARVAHTSYKDEGPLPGQVDKRRR